MKEGNVKTSARREPSVVDTRDTLLKYGMPIVTMYCRLSRGKGFIETNLHRPQDRDLRCVYWIMFWLVFVPFHLLQSALAGPKVFFRVFSACRLAARERSALMNPPTCRPAAMERKDDGKRLGRSISFVQKTARQVGNEYLLSTSYPAERWRPCRYSSPHELAKDLFYHAGYTLADMRIRGTGIQPDMKSIEFAIREAKESIQARSAVRMLSGKVISFLNDLTVLTRGDIIEVLKLRLETPAPLRVWNRASTGLKTGVSDLRARRVSLVLSGRLSKSSSSRMHAIYGLTAGMIDVDRLTEQDVANWLLCEALTDAFVKVAEEHASEDAIVREIDFVRNTRHSLDIDTTCWAGSYDPTDFSYPGKVTFDLSHRGCEDLGEFAVCVENTEKLLYLVRYGHSAALQALIKEYDEASKPDLSSATIDHLRMLQLSGRMVSGHHSCLWRALQGCDRGKVCILPELTVSDVREHLYSEGGHMVFMYTNTPIKITAVGGTAHAAHASQSAVPDGIDDLVVAA